MIKTFRLHKSVFYIFAALHDAEGIMQCRKNI